MYKHTRVKCKRYNGSYSFQSVRADLNIIFYGYNQVVISTIMSLGLCTPCTDVGYKCEKPLGHFTLLSTWLDR